MSAAIEGLEGKLDFLVYSIKRPLAMMPLFSDHLEESSEGEGKEEAHGIRGHVFLSVVEEALGDLLVQTREIQQLCGFETDLDDPQRRGVMGVQRTKRRAQARRSVALPPRARA